MTVFIDLVRTSQRVGATTGRLAKVRELAALLKTLSAAEIEPTVLYLSGEIPQGKIGIGYAALRAAAAAQAAQVESLSVEAVGDALTVLAGIRGAGSAARREAALRELFARATAEEQAFLLRLMAGDLRQGALAGVMTDAIAAAAALPASDVRRAAMFSRSLGAVARAALLTGAGGLEKFQLELFSPVAPMLAQTAEDTEEALQVLQGEAAFDWKLDGARVQLHKQAQDVRIYTRALNEVTAAVPELVELARQFPANVLVLDGEAIALDESGRPHPFQITMRRFGRKLNVEALRSELPIDALFFDCLRFEEQTLIGLPAQERFEFLSRAVPAKHLVQRLVTRSQAEADAFYDAALSAGHEGVVAKRLDSVYEAGNRGAGWLKIKRAHTLDLVIIAVEWGSGRRTGKLSNLHLGALNPSTGEYVMLGKTFKGLTDAMLEWQTRELLARETHRDEWTVYVRPEIVVEIAFSDLQASRRYPGGLALRLARVKRFRDDKRADEADTIDTVRKIAAAQGGSLRPSTKMR